MRYIYNISYKIFHIVYRYKIREFVESESILKYNYDLSLRSKVSRLTLHLATNFRLLEILKLQYINLDIESIYE